MAGSLAHLIQPILVALNSITPIAMQPDSGSFGHKSRDSSLHILKSLSLCDVTWMDLCHWINRDM
jgi:hypothetical protein